MTLSPPPSPPRDDNDDEPHSHHPLLLISPSFAMFATRSEYGTFIKLDPPGLRILAIEVLREARR